MTAIAALGTGAAWKALDAHYPKVRELHFRELFADFCQRSLKASQSADGQG